MASDTIKGAGDIYEKDLYGDLAKSAKEALPLMEKLNQVLKTTTASNLKLVESQIKDVEGLKKVTEGVNNTNKAFNQKLALDKETIKLEQKLKANRTKQSQQNDVIALQIQTEKKAKRELSKETLNLTGAYTKEAKKLNDLRNKYKNLAVSEKGVSKEQKILLSQITKLDTKLKKIDATVGQSQRNVGNYGSAWNKVGSVLKGGLGVLGITAGLSGLVRVMSGSIKIAKEFEQGNANLASVLGTTKDKITALTDDAKRLGAATSFSATQVSTLQTEFAKLGFNEKEILNATEATLDLAAATGSDLGEAAAITGATLGGFGLDAKETGRVADVMAKSFSTSALDLEKFKEAMKGAAPAAKAVGISVEETTALLGTLANAGISGSKAGNNLKTSFINLNAAGLTLEQGLEKVAKSEDKLGTAAKLVGKNAAASFLVLSEGVDTTKELTIGFQNAGGAAKRMADEQLDTLEGKTKILGSAWEGLVLSLLAGDGAFSSISKGLVEAATSMLSFLTTSEGINKEWLNQRENIESLNVEILENSDRYDELTEKTELTKDEQIELDEVIQQLAKDVPTAVTEFDKYGKALTVSTDITRKFAEQQKNLMLVTNAEEILNTESAIKDLNTQLRRQNDLYKVSGKGLQKYDRGLEKATNGSVRFRDATAEEVAEFTKRKNEIASSIDGNELYLAQLRGETTAAEDAASALNKLTQEEIDAAREKEEAAKEAAKSREKRAKEIEKEKKEAAKKAEKDFKERAKIQLELDKLEIKRIKDERERKKRELQLDFEEDVKNLDLTKDLQNQLEIEKREELRLELQKVDDKFDKIEEEKAKLTLKAEKDLDDKLTDLEIKKGRDRIKLDSELSIAEFEQRRSGFKTEADFEKEKAEQLKAIRIKAIDEEIELLQVAGQEKDKLKIEQLKAEKAGLFEFSKQDKENAEERLAIQQALLEKSEESFLKASNKKIEDLDEQFEASKENENRLRDLAAKGSLDAQQSISVEAKKQADLKRAKEKEERKQELVSAGFKIFTALLDQGKSPQGATLETAALLGALPAIIEAIPAFYEGTESTGTVSNALDSNGGRMAMLHDNERVMTEKQNNKMGGIGNDEAANIIEKYNMGELFNHNSPDISGNLMSSIKLNGLSELRNEMRQVNESIKAIKMPKTSMEADYVRQILKVKTQTGNKIITEISKLH